MRFRKSQESRSIHTDMEQSLRFIIEQGKVRVRTNGRMSSICIFFKADKYLGMRWTALEKCVHTIE